MTNAETTSQIVIVHLSDLHARESTQDQLRLRTKSLLKDLKPLSGRIDLVIFSGDAAYAGKATEFELARTELFDQLVKQLRLSRKKIVLVPGNHDVDRSLIDDVAEAGLRSLLTSPAKAEEHFNSTATLPGRLEAFGGLLRSLRKEPKPFEALLFPVKGVNIGVAAFNSAWRCSDDDDKGRLFLTESIINTAASKLETADIRIAVFHHPLDWFHPSEQMVVQEDLKRRFDILLSGHLHSVTSLGAITPSHNTLQFASRAVFDSQIDEEGYNIYLVDFEDKKFHAHYRKYYRRRDAFDKDTEHAQDGQHAFPLPTKGLAPYSQIVLAQRISTLSSALYNDVRRQLQRFQTSEAPIFVTPKLIERNRKGGLSAPKLGRISVSKLAEQDSLVLGGHEVGKTVLLQSVCADINTDTAQRNRQRLGVYVDLRGHHTHLGQKLERYLDDVIRQVTGDPCSYSITLFCDHINETDLQQLQSLHEIATRRGWRLVIAVASTLFMDTVSASAAYFGFALYELQTWGPSRIREFVKKLFSGGPLNVDAAYSFVVASLRDTDIPATPVVVALYLAVFPTLGNQITSLSFLRLLERIEQYRLESLDPSSSYSLYHKREILMRLAKLCLERDDVVLPREIVEAMIAEYFERSLLVVDIPRLLLLLDASRIIAVSEKEVAFSYYAFYDYYLAQSFERGIVDINAVTSGLSSCIASRHALSLHGGLRRENVEMLLKLFALVEQQFGAPKPAKLADLDIYIRQALEPSETEAPEEVAERHTKQEVNYEAFDDAYEKTKQTNAAVRRKSMMKLKPEGQIQELEFRAESLKMFYNVFRNLENVDGEAKIELLDRILDFHITLNFALIDLFSRVDDSAFRTFTGYFVTLAGQAFLHAHAGNESLRRTIEEAMRRAKSDFKKLILIMLYTDLRLPHYTKFIEEFLRETKSPAGIEIVYHRLTRILIEHEEPRPPESVVGVFKLAFEKRQHLYGRAEGKGKFTEAYQQTLAARELIWRG